ncbi:RidA family protein [Alkalimonas amylolytica]|uniref:Enamine deaminase RidA, house cleaning of reactive enamine intermediates, YjgF/YER057c/UK114 family n=1 Tax=Alkalimonas amylolytica TaxID=152573 RepID=A0A1H4DFE7_ALKAM|nr:RidA family protein [Alkalimonas amylolytica]SEA71471.1 Enamine deaminase RidA, house cleaning of reactive enamine intermediates, YjgF/YER057c/UK114 family [Alkalimonas amylolytica]
MPIQRLNPSQRWSDATVFHGIAHFVEVPEDTSADMAGQARQIFQQAEQTLAALGSDHSKLLSATIYITDSSQVDAFNQCWDAWLPAGCAPSRACIKVELLDPAMLVEIAFVAACSGDS